MKLKIESIKDKTKLTKFTTKGLSLEEEDDDDGGISYGPSEFPVTDGPAVCVG